MTTRAQPRGWHNNAWADVGTALYDIPDTELTAIAERLRELAHTSPGRTGDLYTAFAAMADTEINWRNRATA